MVMVTGQSAGLPGMILENLQDIFKKQEKRLFVTL